ncbi:hypothetical protein Bca52824_035635 [Brassica carinata]|uniref:DUF7792 domain-containing protein n=1 Tax=Brassica carinata TaxID=52824 RepID=A0A8X7S4N3_BRACI|nr:hypothetical protein Bca52824_035635 [Brassica carinata]
MTRRRYWTRLSSLVLKCRANGIMKRVFTIIPTAFHKMYARLENSRGVSWLLRVSAPAEDHSDADYLGLPPLAANELILCLIWEHIALLHTGSLEDRSDAASSLVSLSRDNDRYTKLIIEERGVGSLLTEGEQVSSTANFTCYRNSTRNDGCVN